MTYCRICHQMTLAIGFDDHETICAGCLTEAVRDPEVIEIRGDADPVPPLPDDIFSDELAGLLDASFPEPAVAGLLELPAPFPFPADLTDREAELIDRFFALDADEQAALLDELDGSDDDDDGDDAVPDERDRLFAELGFAAPFIPESRDDRPGDAAADEYPGYRHFRVIESDWVDGDRRWIIRDVYRKAD